MSENSIKTNILKAEVFEVYDTLSDEERLKLMQEVEPNATYTTWDTVQDFDLIGLDEYLNQPMTLESSVYLWDFLIACFENKIFTIQNFYGNYTFAYTTEQNVSFDALYWRRLKTAVWLFDKDGNLFPPLSINDVGVEISDFGMTLPKSEIINPKSNPPSVKKVFLHGNYTQHPFLLQYLFY